MRATFLVVVATASLLACVTPRAPVVKLANARGSILAAEQLDADRYPTSATYLAYARQEAKVGAQLYELRRDRRARTMLARAEADADLALALAREEPAREEARRVREEVRQLQQQMEAESGGTQSTTTETGTGTEVQP